MNNEYIIDELEKVQYKLSDEQRNILKTRGGLCILSCAGSGKTTTLANLVVKRVWSKEIHDPSRLLITTYSVAGKNELEERMNQLAEKVGIRYKFEIRTLHSAFYKILSDFNIVGTKKAFGLKTVCSNYQRTTMIAQAIRSVGAFMSDDEVANIDSLISYQINNMMTDDELAVSSAYNIEIGINTFADIREAYKKAKDEAQLVDFDDLQVLTYVILRDNIDARKYVSAMWQYYYIDEFQDVSKIQFEIIKMIATDSSKVVFIGDDDQCIYEWRGADPTIILNIKGYYDVEKMMLSTNYRCGSEIVKIAVNSIENNHNRYEKSISAFNDGGKVEVVDTGTSDLVQQSTDICRKIYESILSGVSCSDIAVLCRNNAHGSILYSMLAQKGVPVRAAKDMKFTDNSTVKDLNLIYDMTVKRLAYRDVNKILWKIAPGLGKKHMNSLSKIMDKYALNFVQALKVCLEKGCGLKANEDNVQVNMDMVGSGEVAQFAYCAEGVKEKLCKLYLACVRDNNQEVFSGITSLYAVSMCELINNDDRLRNVNSMVRYAQMIAKNKGVLYFREMYDSIRQIESMDLNSRVSAVNISTIHGAKGKEWKHVYMVAVDSMCFPDIKSIGNMLYKGVKVPDVSKYIDSERRVFYVALTRAKDKLYMYVNYKKAPDFFLEMLKAVQQGVSNSYTITKACNNKSDDSIDIVKAVEREIGNGEVIENASVSS